MEDIISDLTDTDQTGYVQFRQSQDNMKHALNISDNVTKTYKESVFLCLDAKKPFDSAQWE